MFAANRLSSIKPSVIHEMTRLAYGHNTVNICAFPKTAEIFAKVRAKFTPG